MSRNSLIQLRDALIQLRRDTAANWTSANPILEAGEAGVETDTAKIKFGDGTTAWTSLGYLSAAATTSWGGITGTLSAQSDLNTALSGKASTGAVGSSGVTMATARILGRTTATTGAVEEISIGSGLSLSAGVLSLTGGGSGTVTSVALSGGTTGLTATGSPITTSGTITLGGTLAVANGGTGVGTLTGYVKGSGTSALTASASIPAGDITGLATIATTGSASDLGAGTVPAAQMPALTGDVTTSAGAVATTIANGAVTNAKLADVATATFKGRTTAGTGVPEDLSATQATALLNTVTTSLKGLAPASGGGTANFLRADGTWAAPAGGTPGGSTTQVQYNSAGAFAGDSGLTFDATNKALTIGGATVTTSNPVLNLSQTWNAGAVTFTGKITNITDTASAAASRLEAWQVGGVDKFSVSKTGHITVHSTAFNPSILALPTGYSGIANISIGGSAFVGFFTGPPTVLSCTGFGFASAATNTPDIILARDAANTLAQRNGTNAQTERIYGTYTDASNYRRIAIAMTTAGVGTIAPEGAGTGASGNILALVTGATTVAGLPAASSALTGARLFVTDANATTFLSTVAGGGANKVPVVCDGTNWLIG